MPIPPTEARSEQSLGCRIVTYTCKFSEKSLGVNGAGRIRRLKLTRFRGVGQALNGGFSDAQDASALFT